MGGGAHGFLLHAFFAQRVAALRFAPTTADGGKEELGMLVPFPPASELEDHLLRDGNVTRFATLALGDEQATGLGIDVRDLDVDAFGETEAARVEE